MARLQRVVLVCVNRRDGGDPRGCCAARGSAGVLDAFRAGLHERGLRRIARAVETRCLDQCARGATVVVYPDDVWYGGVTQGDVEEIIEEHVIGGRPVARLELAPDDLTGLDPARRALAPLARPDQAT